MLVSSLVWSHVFWLYQVISSLHPQFSNQQPLFPHSQNGILVLNKYLKKSSNHSSNGFSGHNRSISWQPGQFDDFLSPQNVPEKHQKWIFPATNPWNLPSFPMESMPLAALLAPPRSPAKSWENHGKNHDPWRFLTGTSSKWILIFQPCEWLPEGKSV